MQAISSPHPPLRPQPPLRWQPLALGLLPLLLAAYWQTPLSAAAYSELQLAARPLPDLLRQSATPLYTLLLAQSPFNLEPTAVFLSSLGWSVVGWLLCDWLRQGQRPFLPLTLAALLTTTPALWLTLGSGQSWTIALAWLATWLARRGGNRWLQTAVCLLLTLQAPTWPTLLLLLLLSQHTRPLLLIILPALALWLWRSPASALAGLENLSALQPILPNELTTLLPLLALVGLIWLLRPSQHHANRWHLTLLLWTASAALTGDLAAATAGLWLLAGLALTRLFATPRWGQPTAVFLLLLLGLGQLQALWTVQNGRFATLSQLEQQLFQWLREDAAGTATLLATPRLGYLTGWPTTPWPETVEPTAVLAQLQQQPLDYLVLPRSLPWQAVSDNGWFRLNYAAATAVSDPSYPFAPLTVWRYRPPLADGDTRHPIHVRVPDRLRLLGYQLAPRRFQPGDTLQLTLDLQALAETAVAPVPFQAIVRLVSAQDNSTQQEWERPLPGTIDAANWQPGQILTEPLRLPTRPDLASGAYLLNLSLRGLDEPSLWPISLDNDINQLDRVALGYVAVPEPADQRDPVAITAQYGDGITLAGYALGAAQPGQPLMVTLYWQPRQPPTASYTVFVHLFNENGELMANHDGVPQNGRFPTHTWLPGDDIADPHPVPLPADLPPGSYQLKVGLYLPSSGERLPVTTPDGSQPADHALLLTEMVIP